MCTLLRELQNHIETEKEELQKEIKSLTRHRDEARAGRAPRGSPKPAAASDCGRPHFGPGVRWCMTRVEREKLLWRRMIASRRRRLPPSRQFWRGCRRKSRNRTRLLAQRAGCAAVRCHKGTSVRRVEVRHVPWPTCDSVFFVRVTWNKAFPGAAMRVNCRAKLQRSYLEI